MVALAWACLTFCAGVAIVRVAGWEDHWFLLVGLIGVLPLLLLPAYATLAVGVWQRRWALTAVSMVLIAGHLSWTIPYAIPHGQGRGGALKLRIYSHNILYRNSDVSGIARTIRRDTPDIVVLLELSRRNLRPLATALNAGQYPYRLVRPDIEGAFGFGVWSRFPMTDAYERAVDGFPVGDVTVHDGTSVVRLLAIHTVGPVSSFGLSHWKAELAWLRKQVLSRHGQQLILAGDFNATAQHGEFRRLLAAGVRDAHAVHGGWDPTWPRTWWWLPPVMRIDHVLVTSGISVRDQHTVDNSGSDHAGLVTDLSI